MISLSENRPAIYLDECVDHGIVPYLRRHGLGVTTTRDAGMFGASDGEQLAFAAARALVLVSYNRRHFAQLHGLFRQQGRTHAGVALLRPAHVRRLGHEPDRRRSDDSRTTTTRRVLRV